MAGKSGQGRPHNAGTLPLPLPHLPMDTPVPPPPPRPVDGAERRRLIGLFASSLALASCGGGGSSNAPAPEAAPAPAPPAPSPAVDGPAWWGLGRDAQHSAQGAVATQPLNRIAWRIMVDEAPPVRVGGQLLVHYGSPVITSHNTVLVPVKTNGASGFRIEARAGADGALLWQQDSDYQLPPRYDWMPSWNLALDPDNRLFAPAAGGLLMVIDNPDAPTVAPRTLAFYGDAAYAAAPADYAAAVTIHTPPTVDRQGTVYFGFMVTGSTPIGLVSGIARIAADGSGSWVGAAAAAGDAGITKVAMNSAPALSNDGQTLYVAVNSAPDAAGVRRGLLLALDSRTLATQARAPLLYPSNGAPADVNDDGTASPTIGPDGDVYFGVLESRFGSHNGRGWLLHFDATLARTLPPGSFGWDDTASIVPASAVPSYTGVSGYLLMTKYNNYAGVGTGDGLNRIVLLDPGATQADALSGLPVLREVLSILGPTPDGAGGAVKEWCINTAAVDPLTRSVLANSEDGWLYRWDLASNSFTQRIQLTSGIAESYTPTAIGADGTVYAINNAVLFAVAG